MLAKTVLLCFLFVSCNQAGSIREVNTDWLSREWVHSHEEDNAEQQYSIYRPVSHYFPPSRGRNRFEIKDKGVLISHPIAPSDGNLTIEQRWTLKDNELSFIIDRKQQKNTGSFYWKKISLS